MVIQTFLGLNLFNLVLFASLGLARNCEFFAVYMARMESVMKNDRSSPLALLAAISVILALVVGWKEILVLKMFNDIRKAVTK